MNWKCPVCGNDENSEDSIRCPCGNEIVETDINRLLIIPPPNMNLNRSIWKDASTVIVISLVIAALSLPFQNILPTLLKVFVNHYASIVGYLFLCYHNKKVEFWRLGKVALAVWAILTPIYLIMYWHLIGTKYTLSGIVFGGLKSEIVSVVLGGLSYFLAKGIIKSIKSGGIFRINHTLIRPKWLKEVTALLCIFNISGYAFIDINSKHLSHELIIYTTLIIISYCVLWYFWHGKNWARILVILGSVLSLAGLVTMGKHTYAQICIDLAEAAIGVFLLWWLNTQRLKDYFTRSKENSLTPGDSSQAAAP